MTGNLAELGIFTGVALLLTTLIPIWKTKVAKRAIKDPKTVFYEPTIIIGFLWYIPAALVLFLLTTIPYGVPGYEAWITNEIDRDTFLSGLIMIFQIFIPLFGPSVIYGYYIFSHYDRVVEYRTPAWEEHRKSLK